MRIIHNINYDVTAQLEFRKIIYQNIIRGMKVTTISRITHVMMIYFDKTKGDCFQEFPQKTLVATMRLTRVTMLTMVDAEPETRSLSSGFHQSGRPSVMAEVSQST